MDPLAQRRPVDPYVYEVYQVASGVDDCGDLGAGSSSYRAETRVFHIPASKFAQWGVLDLLLANGGDDLRPFVVVRDGVRPPTIGRCGHVSKVPLPFRFSCLRGILQIRDKELHNSLTLTVRLRISAGLASRSGWEGAHEGQRPPTGTSPWFPSIIALSSKRLPNAFSRSDGADAWPQTLSPTRIDLGEQSTFDLSQGIIDCHRWEAKCDHVQAG